MNATKDPRFWPIVRGVVLVVVLGLIIILGYRQLMRLAGEPVPVARHQLNAGDRVGAGDLEIAYLRRVPPGAILNRAALNGRELGTGKREGDPFFGADFAPRSAVERSQIAEQIPEGRFLVTIDVHQWGVPITQLRQGDRLEIIASKGNSATVIAVDAFLVGWSISSPRSRQGSGPLGIDLTSMPQEGDSGGRTALVLALHPKDVLRVSRAKTNGSWFTYAIHSRENIEGDSQLTLRPKYGPSRAIEFIQGESREWINVR